MIQFGLYSWKRTRSFVVKYCLCAVICATPLWAGAQNMMRSNQVKTNYPDSTVVFSFTRNKLKKLDRDETYYWFQNQQVFATQYGYSGHLLHGPYRVFYKSGQLQTQGQFDNGRQVGEWKYWTPEGELIGTINHSKKGIGWLRNWFRADPEKKKARQKERQEKQEQRKEKAAEKKAEKEAEKQQKTKTDTKDDRQEQPETDEQPEK